MKHFSKDSVAQLVEHLTFNQGVLGSSPSGITVLKASSISFVEAFLRLKLPLLIFVKSTENFRQALILNITLHVQIS